MPTYTILLFGITRDLLQQKEIDFEMEHQLTAGELLSAVKSKYPSLNQLPSLRIAVEQHFPESDFLIKEGMEIALIPPVSGG